jgi:hypothetical protein
MTKPRVLIDRQNAPNIGNMVSKLRRLRTEVAQLLQQIDDALARVEANA